VQGGWGWGFIHSSILLAIQSIQHTYKSTVHTQAHLILFQVIPSRPCPFFLFPCPHPGMVSPQRFQERTQDKSYRPVHRFPHQQSIIRDPYVDREIGKLVHPSDFVEDTRIPTRTAHSISIGTSTKKQYRQTRNSLDHISFLHLQERQSRIPDPHPQPEIRHTGTLIQRVLVRPFERMAIVTQRGALDEEIRVGRWGWV
jgi:hypothetical protein